ncbi:unnamed protein product [Clonostachys byssicola]|uniref:Xylanolytic transcriptional activator regulatory domain-containing protein n=1 Tax=Clonostachys byssicola TaxID=160290 RepID=A0A9N9XXB6_9HYPO|nr:unnamed protein product [Clonostachys byssicola]
MPMEAVENDAAAESGPIGTISRAVRRLTCFSNCSSDSFQHFRSNIVGIVRPMPCEEAKIRCDRLSPCSNCRAIQHSCSSGGGPFRHRESRQRVLISTEYEHKIDRIEYRLTGIERLLQDSHPPSSTQGPAERAGQTAEAVARPSSELVETANSISENVESERAFEGDSSMTAATVFASEFLENAVERSPSYTANSPVHAAVLSLKEMASMQSLQSSKGTLPYKRQIANPALRGLQLPPQQPVLSILREMKEISPITLTVICFFIPMERFVECCREVYFALEDFSLSTFLIVNAGLRYLFQEKHLTASEQASMEEYRSWSHLCRCNVETALANLSFLLPASSENIEALLLGSIYCIETSQTSLAWQLSAGAAQMCQTLGWHRLPSHSDSSVDRKLPLFWFTYLLDKGLALRLGRISVLQDHEITLRRQFNSAGVPREWQNLMTQWIHHSEIVGKVYQDLYSPATSTKPMPERTKLAEFLLARLKETMDASTASAGEARAATGGQPLRYGFPPQSILAMLLKFDEVWYWASVTLVHRALRSNEGFSEPCIQAARSAFKAHRECIHMTETSPHMKAAYLLWTIIYTPFTPLIVIFCHVIESGNTEDLRILSDFTGSLESVSATTEPIKRLHSLCQVLRDVAAIFVGSKAQNSRDQLIMAGNEFDTYLGNMMGLPVTDPSRQNSVSALEMEEPAMVAETHVSQLRGWMAGNPHIFSMLEDDLSQYLR